jgi:poly-beta-1,6-N-acetyl-D-glucosamine synthase
MAGRLVMKGDSIMGSVDAERRDAGLPAYVVITPARNEAAFIEQTARSMASQTVPPLKWVVVSDGSTDGTDEIVRKYSERFRWIELVRMPERAERHFAAKVYAFNAGYAKVKDLPYEVICNLDADVSFGEDHFEFLLGKFASHPTLGVAGTAFIEGAALKYDYTVVNIEDVQGQCQVFRRQCFEEIGGYVPIKNGGIDVVPVYLARMKGWQTRTFTERTYIHHRISGTAQCSATLAYFKEGKKDSYLGVHPLWEVLRAVWNMKNRPYVAGGLLLLSGYIWEGIAGKDEPVPAELVVFRRKEQMQRLRTLAKRFLGSRMRGGPQPPPVS